MLLESAEPCEIHHFATLLGYGACAINPYLAQETIRNLVDTGALDKDYYAAVYDYNSAVLHGIVKIAWKCQFTVYNRFTSRITAFKG